MKMKIFMAAITILLMSTNVMAMDKEIYRTDSAWASWSSGPDWTMLIATNIISSEYYPMGTEIYLYICENSVCKYGNSFTPQNILNIEKFDQAILVPIEVNLSDYNDNYAGTVTVSANWIGIGDIHDEYRSDMFKSDNSKSKSYYDYTFRQATSVAIIDGQSLASTDSAGIDSTKTIYKWLDK